MRVSVVLALLLFPLPFGCGDADDGDTGGSSVTSLTSSGTDSAGTTGQTTTSASSSETEASSGSTSTTTAGSDTSGSTGGAADVPGPCVPYCQTRVGCGLDDTQAACEDSCAGGWETFEELSGTQCLSDYTVLLNCLSALSCSDLETFEEKQGQPNETSYPCRNEDVAFLISCQ